MSRTIPARRSLNSCVSWSPCDGPGTRQCPTACSGIPSTVFKKWPEFHFLPSLPMEAQKKVFRRGLLGACPCHVCAQKPTHAAHPVRHGPHRRPAEGRHHLRHPLRHDQRAPPEVRLDLGEVVCRRESVRPTACGSEGGRRYGWRGPDSRKGEWGTLLCWSKSNRCDAPPGLTLP